MPSISFASSPEGATLYIDGNEIHCACIFRPIVDKQTKIMCNDAAGSLINDISDKAGIIDLKNSDAIKANLQDTLLDNGLDFLFVFGHGYPATILDDNDVSIGYSDLLLNGTIIVTTTCESGRSFCKDAVITGKAQAAIGYNKKLVAQLSGNSFADGFSECFQEAQKSIITSIDNGETDVKKIIETAYASATAKYNYHIDLNSGLTKNLLQIDRDNLTYYTNAGVQTTINIDSSPITSGAEVFIDGKGYAGTTPITNLSVRSEGNFISSARAPGYIAGSKTIIVPDTGGSFNVSLVDSCRPVDYITNDVWIERKDTTHDTACDMMKVYNNRFVVCGGEWQGRREDSPMYLWYFCNRGENSYPISVGTDPDLTEFDPCTFTIPAHGTVGCFVKHHGEEEVGNYCQFTINGTFVLNLLMTANLYFKRFDVGDNSVDLEWNRIPDAEQFVITGGARLYTTTATSFYFPEPYPPGGITVEAERTINSKIYTLTYAHR